MTKYKNFEEFLKDEYAKQYTGTDDDMLDDYHSWLEMDIDKVMKLADVYVEVVKMQAEEETRKLTLVR